MTRKASICQQSAAVVDRLSRFGPATLAELLDAYPQEGRARLRKRLCNLVDGNWLDIAWTPGGEMLWLVAPRARAALPKPQAPTPSAPPVLVPPRRINVMVGNYTPPPMAPARPGALDYQRYASQGVRC